MEDTTFLDDLGDDYDNSNATLKIVDFQGGVYNVSDRISPFRLLDKCPLLYHAFEYSSQGRLQASIEAPSRAGAIALLRYCYTGSYLPPGSEFAPILLLLHAQVYKIAEDFDMPELQLSAHGNFSVQVDCACSLPMAPQDLLETIRYVYIHLASSQARQQQGLVHTLLHYCISRFQYHRLGESTEFLEAVRQIPDFRQDLCRINMERNFEDSCAFEIIGLALDTLQPQCNHRPTILASRDLPEVMLYDKPASPPLAPTPVLTHIPNTGRGSVIESQSSLVHRPKLSVVNPTTSPSREDSVYEESSSEDEGFHMVYRPKPHNTLPLLDPRTIDTPDSNLPSVGLPSINLPPVNVPSIDRVSAHPPSINLPSIHQMQEEPMSSPEIIPSQPIDILAATGSNYSDDDEWTML
ncbi:hypothetical protein DE146DRAFT_476758 [Phaeosphaeria sp. MPI-PUGE-AT-0046c]|nr:hypothetical protein DE146DRAFT_476758 [Phaeosphaeria sp. MPI-PUGE-AT-0046c]